ncbi:hypothetical protein ACGFX4_21095 [Kitasatospora sp. NPDC048365]|uniref:Integral membrane protein n=1 Tax=Kitasatospora terrestris TaxID=258051 RepID=A0ABP9DRE9_9ACTN
MSQVIRGMPPLTLNTDGHPHPRENTLVVLAAVLGLLSFVTTFFYSLHILSSWTGLIGIVLAVAALWSSVTTAERFVTVIALGAASVGFYLGIAHGGLI